MPDITFEDYHACPDNAVTEITPEGVRTENGTFIRFADCAANFAALHGGSGRCVGERDISDFNAASQWVDLIELGKTFEAANVCAVPANLAMFDRENNASVE